ncbi:MAG: hypothetical protein DWQ04_10945, partial [Chloroflexi bacterium]
MLIRYLPGLTLTAILLVLFIPSAGAVQNPWAAPPLADPSSTESNQTALAQADASDAFFDDSYVHEIYLTFDNADYGTDGWYATLSESHANDAD